MSDESLALAGNRANAAGLGSLQSVLNRPLPGQPPKPGPDEGDPLPPDSADYQAFGRTANKPLLSFLCLMGNADIIGLQYAHLETPAEFLRAKPERGAQSIVLRFSGHEPTEMRIEGRNLGELFGHLMQHRIPWLRELPPARDYEPDAVPVITRIGFQILQKP